MTTVYVVEWDNGESYEDNQTWMGNVFSTKASAVEYLTDKGLKEEDYNPLFYSNWDTFFPVEGKVGFGANEYARLHEREVLE